MRGGLQLKKRHVDDEHTFSMSDESVPLAQESAQWEVHNLAVEKLRHTVEEISVFEREVDERVRNAYALRVGGDTKEEIAEKSKL